MKKKKKTRTHVVIAALLRTNALCPESEMSDKLFVANPYESSTNMNAKLRLKKMRIRRDVLSAQTAPKKSRSAELQPDVDSPSEKERDAEFEATRISETGRTGAPELAALSAGDLRNSSSDAYASALPKTSNHA